MIDYTTTEGHDSLDPEWMVHKTFGGWQIKTHGEFEPVLEYTRYAYPIEASRAHELDWMCHIADKDWRNNDQFPAALMYFRGMIAALAESV